jgi:ABC-type transporter Mla subunit MlaD
MRRAALIFVALAALGGLAAFAPFGSSDPGYLVRGYFDNGGFIVSGEDIRIAGATVGSVDSVDVSMPGEAVHADGRPDPGKAVVVMKIIDAGFENFLSDASCIIRPQSLLGEKFIDCTPTAPRAPGSPGPPPLKLIADGKPGAGQRFLPLENNGKQVDLDIVQDIFRLPYAQRFRLILNELGIGLAARGHELEAIVRRADPALRETDQVLAILAQQNHALAKLADDSETVLAPLARERAHVSGFIANAGATAAATAERGAALQAGLQRFPRFLSQLRTTMAALRGFSDQAQPVFADLGAAAPSLTRVTKLLGPFSSAGETALTSLGDAASNSTDNLVAADSVVKDLRHLSRVAAKPSGDLKHLLGSLRDTKGFQRLLDFVYFGAGSVNGFDQYGHFLRSELVSSNCVDYNIAPFSGCGANFTFSGKAKSRSITGKPKPRQAHPGRNGGGSPRDAGQGVGQGARVSVSSARRLLDFLIGPQPGNGGSGSAGTSGAGSAPGTGSGAGSGASGYSTQPEPGGTGK